MPIDSHLSYLDKHALLPAMIQEAPDPALGMVIVAHLYQRKGWLETLVSLRSIEEPPIPVEVLVIVHLSQTNDDKAQDSRLTALAFAQRALATRPRRRIRYHVVEFPDVAPQDFGEGLTRKLAFDEALRRLKAAGNSDAPIVWLDAGVVFDYEHLTQIHRFFQENRKKSSCTVSFEFIGEEENELTLRYALQGLRAMRHPHAFYHMASTVVVRGSAYERASGMNRRKAGADFHFLHKLTPLDQHADCPILPLLYLDVPPEIQAQDTVFAPAAYHLLRDFAERVLASWQQPVDAIVADVSALHPALAAWLAKVGFRERLAGMQASATQAATFRQRFFRWLTVLEVQHFMNFAHPAYFERVPLVAAAATLLGQPADSDAAHLLTLLRARDREPYSN